MKPGDLVAERFLVERVAGRGGMGLVFRALDRLTGDAVALKVARDVAPGGEARFRREARLLAEIAHPGIVRHVAQGSAAEGEAYLAMEWLDGEDLSERGARSPLGDAEAVTLVVRAAEALGAAHARGVVHRDVKPSNLFLVGRDPARVKVLDFGLARTVLPSRAMTATGAVLGTVGYMAPEQARGERDVDARADVFSLGCVLFELLTGRPAFTGEHVVAVLAKVLLEEAPRLSDARPDLSAALDALLARTLAKDRAARPADGAEVARALAGIDLGAGSVGHAASRAALSDAEQRMVSVLLVQLGDGDMGSGSTMRITSGEIAADASLASLVTAFGASIAPLASGALLVTLEGSTGGRDSAARAAALALSLQKALPEARVALATGRAQSSGQGIFGQVIDRAASLLVAGDARGAVRLDEVTTALLDARFETRPVEGAGAVLAGASAARGARTLLGRPTPCVGRDREIGLLEATVAESAAESIARAVVVIGPPGAGKSRVRHELALRLAGGAARTVLFARADAVGAGGAMIVARQLLRAASGVREGDRAEVQAAGLLAHLATLPALRDRERTGEMLVELLGLPGAARPSPALVSARAEPRVMADWLRRSVLAWIEAECAARPLSILIDDAQWADPPTLGWLGDALQKLRDQPLTVIAFARPEVAEAFPSLWVDAGRVEVRLGPLPARAAARLVREALGASADEPTVARIVARADGNAFYLEELIRHVAEGGPLDALPESVLAMAEARLAHLSPDERRVLRAASVFGQTFWGSAVAALAPAAGDRLELLSERELVERTGEPTFAGEIEYRFRHALLRDAAYATLTDADRAAGHRLAGDWLERAGCRDELTLAEHFDRGGDRERAIHWWLGAVRVARGPGELPRIVALATKAIDAGAEGEALLELLLARGYAFGWGADFVRAMADLETVMASAAPGSEPWLSAAGVALYVGTLHGDPAAVRAFAGAMLGTRPARASAACGFGFEKATTALLLAGETKTARALAKVAFDLEASEIDREPLFVANLMHLRALIGFQFDDPASCLRALARERALCAEAGDGLLDADALQILGAVLAEIGDPEGVRRLEEVFRITEVQGITAVQVIATAFLARALVLAGRRAEARAVIEGARGKLPALADRLVANEEATLVLEEGDAARAHALAMPRTAADEPLVVARRSAMGIAARAALALGRPEEAAALTEAALALDVADMTQNRSWLHLVRVEALRALGRVDEARAVLAAARERIERVAATLSEPHRAAWLTAVAPNARTLALAP